VADSSNSTQFRKTRRSGRSSLTHRRRVAAHRYLDQCAEFLGVDLATIRQLAANVESYLRADGTKVGSLMQLECQLRSPAFHKRRDGYIERRRPGRRKPSLPDTFDDRVTCVASSNKATLNHVTPC
jgi:hypothetical protein